MIYWSRIASETVIHNAKCNHSGIPDFIGSILKCIAKGQLFDGSTVK
jgi:hypothetical protein